MLSSSPLELTTRFTAITTGAGSKRAKTADDAAKSGAAHLRYITRQTALGEQVWRGVPGDTIEALHAALRDRMRERAGQGGKCGARVAEKGIISLPNDWPVSARQEAVERIADHLAPENSEAMVVVVSHRDKPGNSHLHFLAVDGFESVSAARMRRPDAKRVRRANVIRLGDRGRPKELREEIALLLADIASRRGINSVEWRSFHDRGLPQSPTIHEGPAARAMMEKTGNHSLKAKENLRRQHARIEEDLDDFFQPGGEFLDLAKIAKVEDPPVQAQQIPKATVRSENPAFENFRKKINRWLRDRYKKQNPRSR